MFGHPWATTQHAPTKTPKGLRFTGICIYVHLRNPDATHRLWERLTSSFLSVFRDVCLLTFPPSSAVINQSTHISAWQNRKQHWKKHRRRKGKDVKEAVLWLMSSSDKWHSPESRANKKRGINLMYDCFTCLSLPALTKYTVFAFCFCYTSKF